MKQYIPASQTKAPSSAKEPIDPPVFLAEGSDFGQVLNAATVNGSNLNLCIARLGAAQEDFKITGR